MAVKLIPYSSVGFIQYLAPLGQLSIGVLIFKEPLKGQSLISFILIWLALLIYTGARLKRKPL
jgi:chloramphenicol-sensitive protein RarD